ncbi:hypothetical protein EVAR_21729_1 [Eumeta japonica]|uniref:Uncharacterized protein n=1 Tax=Eumeta variegata TaxID=151549 RepID=A0A4C1W6C9_EUMVA|nr:hypothetical protein EVAR_21729_1 [Eumeta japonica]
MICVPIFTEQLDPDFNRTVRPGATSEIRELPYFLRAFGPQRGPIIQSHAHPARPAARMTRPCIPSTTVLVSADNKITVTTSGEKPFLEMVHYWVDGNIVHCRISVVFCLYRGLPSASRGQITIKILLAFNQPADDKCDPWPQSQAPFACEPLARS